MRTSLLPFCTVIWVLLLESSSLEAQSKPAPPPGRSPDSEVRTIEVTGNISEAAIEKGQKTSFFLCIANRTPEPIQSVRFDELHAEGFQIVKRSWCAADNPNCELIASQLDAGQSIAVWGELFGSQPHEKETVVSKISWIDSAKTVSSRFSQLGETAIQTKWEHWRSSWVYDLIKDLTLPLVLVGLGTALGIYDKAKENRRQRLDKQLDEERKKDEELRAQTAQTWNSMLPESHKLATEYYMPVDGAASSALDEFIEREKAITEGNQTQQKAAEERAFFYLLLMSRRCRALADDRGGWYFKDRVGEQLVARCLENFRVLFLHQPNDAQVTWSVAIGVVDARGKLGPFKAALHGSDGNGALLREAQRNFDLWLTSADFEPALRNLRAMRLVLTYEMNRPYEYWYGSCERLNLSDDVKNTLREAAVKQGSYPTIPAEQVEAYIQDKKET